MTTTTKPDMVNHPPHYQHPSGEQCITFSEWLGFNVGNAFKYCWRQGSKGNSAEDLGKAIWYLDRAIESPFTVPNRDRGGVYLTVHTSWTNFLNASPQEDVLTSALELMWESQFHVRSNLPIARRLVTATAKAAA